MNDSIFKDFVLDTGICWKTNATITYFGRNFPIKICLDIDSENNNIITDEQKTVYRNYLKNQESISATIERLLQDFTKDAAVRFTPRTLLFQQDGSYALLCDDEEDWDDGVAVCMSPEAKIEFQDDYL